MSVTVDVHDNNLAQSLYNVSSRQHVTLLALLDLSVAFDCVDHDILICWLCIHGAALEWIMSFLLGRSQQVYFRGQLSILAPFAFRCPARICFRPSVVLAVCS